MGEIRIVGPGKTPGYPYLVCKKIFSAFSMVLEWHSDRNFLLLSVQGAYFSICNANNIANNVETWSFQGCCKNIKCLNKIILQIT